MKITKGQFASLLILSRVFTLMTYVPLTSDGFSPLDIILAIAFSSALQILSAVPVFIIYDITNGGDIFMLVKNKSPILMKILAFIYAVFFIFGAVNSLSGFRIFLNDICGEGYGIPGMLLLLSVCLYGLFSGISALGKFAGIVMGLFIVMIASICLFSIKDFDILNFSPFVSGDINTLLKAIIEDFARSIETVLIIFLFSVVKGNAKSGFFQFLAGKTIILEAVTIVIAGVLGTYANMTDYPFFKLGGYTGIYAIERLDAVYLVVWTLNALLTVTLFLTAAKELFKISFGKMRFQNTVVALVAGIISYICSLFSLINEAAGKFSGAFAIIIMLFVIPLICLLLTRCRNGSSK